DSSTKREFSRQLAIVLSESGTTDYSNYTPTNKGKNKVLIKDKKDNERDSNQKEKTEKVSNLTHNKAQTYLNTKEILSLKEC
ncbi:13606_t:CDS:2, partial [Gigaspora rosea]